MVENGLLFHRKPKTMNGSRFLTVGKREAEYWKRVILSPKVYIPVAGHLGQNKTCKKIVERFYWKSFWKDVSKSCPNL